MGSRTVEGEGCITMTNGHAVLRVTNTDEWIVRRFAEVVGRGVVYGPYENRSNDHFVRKPFFVWVCNDRAGSGVTIEMLARWLSPKRLARASEVDIWP